MSMIYKKILVTAAISVAAISLAYAQERKVISDITDFDKIELNTSTNVNVIIDDYYSIEVEGDEKRIENTVFDRDGDTLKISNKKRFGGWFGFGRGNNGNLDITITMPNIEAFEINGSGNAEIVGVDNEELELQIHGSGDIYVTGKSEEVVIEVHGSGDVEMDEIAGDDVDVEIHGSGNVEFDGGSCTRMEIEINGSGDVDAKDLVCEVVEIDVSGSGNSRVYATEKLVFDGSGSGSVDVFGKPKEILDLKAKRDSKIKIR
ncbi:MAG: DUF2807 domain-containing protein [Kordiimonadaceae bacterium]|jgi:hypothetical protein|nr:DUF2807 domain-containing protein [Kordiimonadaceae bacterium]